MIKSIKFRNFACFLNEQTISIYSNKEDESKKRINFIFGLPGSGKTTIFNLIKVTFLYMKRWLVFNEDDMLTNTTIKDYFNPNINTQEVLDTENSTEIELVFDNGTFSYKYEWSFNKHFCVYERLHYKINDVLDDWIELFNKELIDYVEIGNKIETIYETFLNIEELDIDYTPTFKGINQSNSILSYVGSISKSEILKEFNRMLDKIEFFSEKDFRTLKLYNFPISEVNENKKYILWILSKININFDDFEIIEENKIVGNFSINFFKNNEKGFVKKINSSKMSESEIKLFLFTILFMRYKSKDCILFIDDFSKGVEFDIFFEFVKAFEKEAVNNTEFQLFAFNNHFFNKMKAHNSKYINVFDVRKEQDGNSEISKFFEINEKKDTQS